MTNRAVQHIVQGVDVADGAGVRLKRTLGQSPRLRHDPFLMLDEFNSETAADYIEGFPSHPHRGFETVTYMLEGHMLHEDHLGNRGDLKSGDVQWMTAGRGIIHSEMPQQEAGRLHGFQLWINLPAAEKMRPASYRDIPAASIPRITLGNGAQVIAIAGTVTIDGHTLSGPVQGATAQPVYLDVMLPADTPIEVPVASIDNAFVYVFEGALSIEGTTVQRGAAALLGEGDNLRVSSDAGGARFLVLAARPLGEPVVQYGPFVMNTVEEVEQSIRDYRDGSLAA